ncbi:MAG TPA: aminotransferase class III-fold pyridoxal phosphate-dependent enzyme [Candidatus Cybelea sp.]|nr:aminotransferase class III-fold pyridoxal phosphate-dependent enzyme [Candidatus Cybelea sp.]
MISEPRIAPRITESEAARLARHVFGLDVSARSLPGEYDSNFHLRSTDDREFVLKIMHPEREESFIEMQCAALEHLKKRAPHLVLPRVCPTQSGQTFALAKVCDGTKRFVWLLTFVPGAVLATVKPRSRELLRSLGQFLGELDAALADFSHRGAQRDLKWDLTRAQWIRPYVHSIPDAKRRALVERFLTLYEAELAPALPSLRRSVVYGDANDYNVLVSAPWLQPRNVVTVIDFGDMHRGVTVSEPAIAAAYAMLGQRNPLASAAALIAGYHDAFPLDEEELKLLYPLVAMRLAVSVTNSAQRKTLSPDDPYVTISEAPAWKALEQWAQVHPRFAHYVFRDACGLPAVRQAENIRRWLSGSAGSAAPILEADLRSAPCLVFDLSVGGTLLGADPSVAETGNVSEVIFRKMKDANASVGIGRYNEARCLYTSPRFGRNDNPVAERRTIHLGMDLFARPGTAIRAPLEGTVEAMAVNAAPEDYGPVVILRHRTGDEGKFFTLYGHLTRDSLGKLTLGQRIAPGEVLACVGDAQENGGWPPHLHFQIILDLLDQGTDFPGVAYASERGVWTSLSPDPNLLLGIPADRFPQREPRREEAISARRELLGKNLSLSYERPLKIVRGWRQYLYDEAGRAYLDVYNNVPLVGHSHPRVVRAVQAQVALLNTNTRYLHDNIHRYAERLTRLLPDPLRVCYFLNSGSEANELALRMARAHTGREDVIVLEHAYHGHTTTLIDISPYKFGGPGGRGRKPWVHVAPLPDDYRGPFRRGDKEAGSKYAFAVGEILEEMGKQGRPIAAYIAETLPSVAGQIVFPSGYLAEVYRGVRRAGGVTIADEVQVGFGRLGTHFWGFQTQDVVPDIVVLGKPIGNGFPLAAVVASQEIADSFSNGMEFFSTFGGNPVACAAGLAVLDVMEEEGLQQNALRVGHQLIARLEALEDEYALIGDVRGSGLYLGVDFVRDRSTREPAPRQASYVVNRLRERGVLTGTDGPHQNVLKLRPSLVFSNSDADLFSTTLEEVLEEDPAQA